MFCLMFILGFFFSLIGLMMVYKHFFMCLLLMEFFLLYLYFYMFFLFDMYCFDYFFMIVYLVFGVCDGVLGLSILVFLIRKSGNDFIDSLSLC
uniref:NADH dehydrogenase subunit 4L n=1 Tax=Zanna robusticephalica TaxID=3081104 RepID=UPI002A7F3141|nr:NADH dehydrogenase subunit 4L [Zanna robusticephalica]WOW98862.1 NADH dehydrogenase subunit 4L [Zanna robusticephalica]